MKNIFLLALLITAGFSKIFSATTSIRDASTGNVTYKQTFTLNSSFSDDDAYEFVQQWFTQSPSKFTRQSGVAPTIKGHLENKAAVEEAFHNNIPLQSLDPESKRVVGRTMVKYYGNPNSSVQLMYIEYYVILEIKGHELSATISHIKYHHFNMHNYKEQVIYTNEMGRRFYDSADKFDALTSSSSANPDITAVNDFLTNDMNTLLADLQQKLQNNNALSSN